MTKTVAAYAADVGRLPPSNSRSSHTIDILLSRSDTNASSSSSQDEQESETEKFHGKAFDAKAFLDQRVMTPLQEICNAVTMLPGLFYSVYFLLSGSWTKDAEQIMYSDQIEKGWLTDLLARNFLGGFEYRWAENLGCINNPTFPHLTALPPPTVLIVALAGAVHPLFSILYHCNCMLLEPSKRIPHWSRRLDHSFIHFASACASYGTTGSVAYFLLNVAFNFDCALKQFETKICPKRNVRRVGMSIIMYTLPVLLHGHYLLYSQFLLMFALAGWSFTKYPIGGWSHSLFHLFLAFLPYLLFTESLQLHSSRAQINLAARCASGTA